MSSLQIQDMLIVSFSTEKERKLLLIDDAIVVGGRSFTLIYTNLGSLPRNYDLHGLLTHLDVDNLTHISSFLCKQC